MRRLPLLLVALPQLALASGLDDYKDQKHSDRPDVTRDTCVAAWMAEHHGEASDAGDRAKAARFCEERQRRRGRQIAGLVVKGASVGAGGAAVVTENAIVGAAARRRAETAARQPTSRRNVTKPAARTASATRGGVSKPTRGGSTSAPYVAPRNPYDFDPSFVAELGGGLASSVPGGTGVVHGRYGHFGAGATSTFFADGDDWLSETDVGPAVFFDSDHIEFGLQPSLLISAGNDVRPELGVGVRSYTTAELGDRVMLHLDPMLGHVNRQWNYHLRVGASYRFTPNVYGRVSYDMRDILDLNDLDVSRAAMQGVFGTVGVRF